jgi:hypothetical protein
LVQPFRSLWESGTQILRQHGDYISLLLFFFVDKESRLITVTMTKTAVVVIVAVRMRVIDM